MWTDTAVGLLKDEMGKRDVIISEQSPKILKLSITRVKLFWGFNIVGCNLNLKVLTGDGYTVNLEVTNSAKDLYGSCDGAVTKAIAAMFEDHHIQEYLSASKIVKDSDCDGINDSCDACPGTPEGVTVDDRGCPLDTDRDGVADYLDKCPGTPYGAVVDEQGCWVIGDALFDFDKYTIKKEYYSVLDEATSVLKKNPDLKIEIQGHTCSMGTEAYNKKLSERRADAVMDYFISKGISETRLTAVGYGLSKPKASNETEAGRILNRRVELAVLDSPV
jgi:flagellar motor protein MotB